jgi:hypothetical protein
MMLADKLYPKSNISLHKIFKNITISNMKSAFLVKQKVRQSDEDTFSEECMA